MKIKQNFLTGQILLYLYLRSAMLYVPWCGCG